MFQIPSNFCSIREHSTRCSIIAAIIDSRKNAPLVIARDIFDAAMRTYGTGHVCHEMKKPFIYARFGFTGIASMINRNRWIVEDNIPSINFPSVPVKRVFSRTRKYFLSRPRLFLFISPRSSSLSVRNKWRGKRFDPSIASLSLHRMELIDRVTNVNKYIPVYTRHGCVYKRENTQMRGENYSICT